jgi:DNA-binding response OmpR family regulator
MEFCPDCGARLDGRKQTLRHEDFDDVARSVCGYRLTPTEWLIMTIFRERFRRMVSIDALMEVMIRHKAEEDRLDDVRALRVRICGVRRALERSKDHRIATDWGFRGYGLFPAGDVLLIPSANPAYHHYRLAVRS